MKCNFTESLQFFMFHDETDFVLNFSKDFQMNTRKYQVLLISMISSFVISFSYHGTFADCKYYPWFKVTIKVAMVSDIIIFLQNSFLLIHISVSMFKTLPIHSLI